MPGHWLESFWQLVKSVLNDEFFELVSEMFGAWA